MTSKRRVHAGLRPESVDRVPVLMCFRAPAITQSLREHVGQWPLAPWHDGPIHSRIAMACATVAPS
jgi:hypothetical protein